MAAARIVKEIRPLRPAPGRLGRPGPDTALKVARARLLRGERVDMGSLAEEVGIARATLYRWFGDRERLLGDVLWSLADGTLHAARERESRRRPGAGRALAVLDGFLSAMAANSAFRAFLTREHEVAGRVLMTPTGNVEHRVVGAVVDILVENDVDVGVQVESLAYAIVRVGEAFLYAEILTGRCADVPTAIDIVRLMLRA